MLVTLSRARTREKSRIIERRRRFFPPFGGERERGRRGGKVFHLSAYFSINTGMTKVARSEATTPNRCLYDPANFYAPITVERRRRAKTFAAFSILLRDTTFRPKNPLRFVRDDILAGLDRGKNIRLGEEFKFIAAAHCPPIRSTRRRERKARARQRWR